MISSAKPTRRVRTSRKPSKSRRKSVGSKESDAGATVRRLASSVDSERWSNEKWTELLSGMPLEFDSLATLIAIERDVIRFADDGLRTLSPERLLALRLWLLDDDVEDGSSTSELPSDHPESIVRGIALKVLMEAFKQRAPEIENVLQALQHSQF